MLARWCASFARYTNQIQTRYNPDAHPSTLLWSRVCIACCRSVFWNAVLESWSHVERYTEVMSHFAWFDIFCSEADPRKLRKWVPLLVSGLYLVCIWCVSGRARTSPVRPWLCDATRLAACGFVSGLYLVCIWFVTGEACTPSSQHSTGAKARIFCDPANNTGADT